MRLKLSITFAILVAVWPTAAYGFEYLFGSKWDVGGGTASLHGYSAPNGPQTPGGATWSIMPAGLGLDPSASTIDTDHSGVSDTIAITGLGVPTWVAADYDAMITSALNQWADVSGFTNLGKVADGGGAAGVAGAAGAIGDIRIGAWRIVPTGVLAHNFAPGSASSAGGNNIFGDMHIDKEALGGPTWVNDSADAGGPGGGSTYDLYTVVLHELGHALGLDHTTVPGSVMEASYKGGRRVLGADDIAGIQALYGGSGTVHFSVAPGTEGLFPVKPPNAVYASAPSNTAVVFVSPMNGTNDVAVPPPGLGLVAGDNIDALSNGTNGSTNGTAVLLFSVDSASTGAPATDVHYSAMFSMPAPPFVGTAPANPGGGDPGNEAAGDIYASSTTPSFGAYSSVTTAIVAHSGKNRLFADEGTIGLQAPAVNGSSGGAPEDELDGMELDGLSTPYFSLSAGSPTLLASVGEVDAHEGGTIPFAYDPPPAPYPLHAAGETRTADDILIGGTAAIYGPGHLMGLNRWEDDGIGDDIDALVVSDVMFVQFPTPHMEATPNSFLDPGLDTALFSLAPGSPSLSIFSPGLGRMFSPADIFLTSFGGGFTLYASAESLGLLPTDNIDALDIRIGTLPPPLGSFVEAVPEPGTFLLAVIGLGSLGFVVLRKKHRRGPDALRPLIP